MVSLPRKCQFCGKSLMHYGSCDCTNGRLDHIDAERKQIAERLKQLDAEEKRLLKGTMQDLGVLPAPVLASDVDPTAGLDPNFNWGGDP